MKKVGVIGSGVVGEALSAGFLKHGYAVMRGTRDPQKLATWKSGAGANASVGTFQEASAFGEIVVLAVKGNVAEELVASCSKELAGKAVLDTTNPIADQAPTNGVVAFFTGPNDSLLERLQKKVPEAHFVKCFSSVGSALMVNPDFGGTKPTMFICGSHGGAKEEARAVLDKFGWDTEDMGAVEAARAIEPLCQLWCIPGMLKNAWTGHAFKLLRK